MTTTNRIIGVDPEIDIRREALQGALYLVRELPSPVPSIEKFRPCIHVIRSEECTCPEPSKEAVLANSIESEQAQLDQVLRLAGHLAAWVRDGVTRFDSDMGKLLGG
jgi:hypothetical protein